MKRGLEHLFIALTGLTLICLATSAAAQSIQLIYSFTNGPIFPYAGLALGPDGSYYGTSQQGGSANVGTVFRVTTNGTVTILASFGNTNGASPETTLALGPDGNFYGTTYSGGTSGRGAVFQITTNGTLTMLHAFSGSTSVSSTNADGAYPEAGLIVGPDGNLYGTANGGGTNGNGVVFQMTTNGVYTTLASFGITGPYYPNAGLILAPDGSFYGTAPNGGANNDGAVFRVTTNGSLTTVASFGGYLTGSEPDAGLTLGPDGNFYGTTHSGGYANNGTVFQVSTNGVLTSLYSFSATVNQTNADGANPEAGLTLGPDGNFYGTTYAGGSNGWGTVFQITTNGTLISLASFNLANGATPLAGLTLGPDGNFYGTTEQSGGGNKFLSYGTVFQITTNGTLTTLARFTNSSGLNPYAGLTLGSDGNLYGTTVNGGISGNGTIFRVTTNGSLTTIGSYTNSFLNGKNPYAALTLGPDGGFYGTTRNGGSNGYGSVFRMTTNGVLTQLAAFANTNGANPYAALTLGPDGNFYGTTLAGGITTNGTVFSITTNGALTTLVRFTSTNGANPYAGLTLGPDGNFYGTTYNGGSNSVGTVFRIATNGTLTTLYSFSPSTEFPKTNGAHPAAGLTLGPDGNLYGTTTGSPGTFETGPGTVFRITTGGALTTLTNSSSLVTWNPYAALTLGSDGNFYGTTVNGGINGTVFRFATNGTLTTLARFDINGANPYAGLTLGPDGNFYGTTYQGGPGGGGVIYRLNLAPSITSQPASQSVSIGGTATFATGVFGTQPLAYQWYFNTNTPLAGGAAATLSFGPVETNQAGQYQLIVSSPYGSATSSPAGLTVLLQPNCYAISNSGSGSITLLLASAPGSTNRLWSTTNLNLPLVQWQPVFTNTADATGLFQFIDTNTGDSPAKFYILSSP